MKNSTIYPVLILAGILIVGAIIFKLTSPHKSRRIFPRQSAPALSKKKISITSSRPVRLTPAPVSVPKIPAPTPKPAPKSTPADEVRINNNDLMVEIADTDATRAQGLSGRTSLQDNEGMLFIFQTPGVYAFWMKDMNFALDLIWIYEGKVIQITPDVPNEPGVADDQLHNYMSASQVDSVLEVDAGWSAQNDIQVGDGVVDQF